MFSGGPPFQLMGSNMFNPESPRIHKRVQWKRIAFLFKAYWKEQLGILLCISLIALLGLIPPLATKYLIDQAIPQGNVALLNTWVGAMIAAAVCISLVGVVQGYLNALVGEGIMRDVRSNLVQHLQKMPIAFFTQTKTGEIMNRVSNDVDSIAGVVTGTLVSIATNVAVMATTVVTIFALNWRLSLISLAIIPFMIWPLWPVGRRMYETRKLTRQKRDQVESLTQETLSLSGVMLVKSFGQEKFESERFYGTRTELMDLEIKLAMIGRWFMAVIAAMIIIGPAIVWFAGGWMAIAHRMTVGTIVTFAALLNRLYGPASGLAGIQVQIVSALAVFERIFDYLDQETEDAKDPVDAGELVSVRGDLVFDHVSFSYDGDRTVLDDISFAIKPGQMVAIVGPSGAGKTTITQLVARFYHPQKGKILVDGVDISQVKLASLRANIGVVTQETYLFHDTIASNLKYANSNASSQELIEACKAANIDDYIRSLPLAYETIVGERGHKLSGGEKQRLAIARALLKNPRILVLDEATSSLDSENENLIKAALKPLMEGRTSLVIAHRLSTVLAADVILVIQNGRLVEQGTHAVLLQRGENYAKVYRQQFAEGTRFVN
jgi:ATP-binding cassette, subfamily B, bacterial